jgi:uncharacterized protein YbjT (DUF2867 family)
LYVKVVTVTPVNSMNGNIATVFGGTGFLCRRVVRHLRERGFSVRIASRHPDPRTVSSVDNSRLQFIQADIRDEQSVADAVAGAYGVVNATSLYVERCGDTFHSVHVEAAGRVAAHALKASVERLLHISGMGLPVALH